MGGFTGSVMIPEGGDTVVASALRSASPLAWVPGGAEAVLHCDDFRIDYRADGSIRQFYSDVSGGLLSRGRDRGRLAGLQPAACCAFPVSCASLCEPLSVRPPATETARC